MDYAALAHYRVKHSKNEFANGKNHINGIENFFSKRVRAQELRLRLATASRRGYANTDYLNLKRSDCRKAKQREFLASS